MSLESEIESARKKVVVDGYDMSIGELLGLYRNGELDIAPDYQRLFRWDESQKTRFIESLLLGIPTPPIFVAADASGKWELVDGLQRVSTLFEFFGELKTGAASSSPLELEGTELLPSLSGVTWSGSNKLPGPIALDLKRTRVRLEILKRGSDIEIKYELFQRLNTGGTKLEPQEVRNCVLVMTDRDFFGWFGKLALNQYFASTTSVSAVKKEEKYDMELVLRYLALRHIKYVRGRDVHDYLDEAARKLPKLLSATQRDAEEKTFSTVFNAFHLGLGTASFRPNGGPLSLAAFEALSVGLSKLAEKGIPDNQLQEIAKKSQASLLSDQRFLKFSGSGVRGSDRLFHIASAAETFVKA